MTTELIGQAQTVDDEDLPVESPNYATELPQQYAHLTERLGQSVLRSTQRVGVNLRWLLAWLLCGKQIDLTGPFTEAELDKQVKAVVKIIDGDKRGGNERLARAYGL